MQRYLIVLEYIGTEYMGSQKQPNKMPNTSKTVVTIQDEVEKAISTLTKTKTKTIFSGRTDAGVNSVGQTVHVDFDEPIVASRFIRSINGLLPKDISISDVCEVPLTFHSQKSAKARQYRYVFLNRSQRKAFDSDLLRVRYDLNIERMNKALSYLKGYHDFSSFKNRGSTNPYTDCEVYEAICWRNEDMVVVDITANRFLYNMVRIIVGTLLDIERENKEPEFMEYVLKSKDRTKAGQTVGSSGLTLIKVEY